MEHHKGSFKYMPHRAGSVSRPSWVVVSLALILCMAKRTALATAPAYQPPPPAGGDPVHLTDAQWHTLFSAAGKRIVTLHFEAVIRQKFYVTPALATQITKGVRQMFPQQTGKYTASAGKVAHTRLVRVDWNIPAALLDARSIQIGGEVDVGPRGKLHKGLAHAGIWIFGHRNVWNSFPGGGRWNSSVALRSSSWSALAWKGEFQNFGLAEIALFWTPFGTPYVPPVGHTSIPWTYRLLAQTHNPATKLATLTYLQLYKGKPETNSTWGKFEYRYVVRRAGGLRVYRQILEAVGGRKGTVRFFQADYKKFVKTGGIWFPTLIHYRNWPHGGGHAFPDETITIKHVVVNGTFPPRTFHFTPPFGAMVTDMRTNPASIYFVGSKNPKFPPTTTPAVRKEGSGKK